MEGTGHTLVEKMKASALTQVGSSLPALHEQLQGREASVLTLPSAQGECLERGRAPEWGSSLGQAAQKSPTEQGGKRWG